jgi:hypothetical protein
MPKRQYESPAALIARSAEILRRRLNVLRRVRTFAEAQEFFDELSDAELIGLLPSAQRDTDMHKPVVAALLNRCREIEQARASA